MTTSRRDFLRTAGAGMAAVAAGKTLAAEQGLSPRPARKKRNVLLYVVDDQGMSDAGCYGNPIVQTPGLDMLASDGTMFRNGFCTTPSCSASRSVILTGLHNHRNGQYGHSHHTSHFTTFDWVKSLPIRMSEAGYRTVAAGKHHVMPKDLYNFDTFIHYEFGYHESPVQMAEECRSHIEADSEQPFFLYYCTREPHRPFHREGSKPISPDEVIVPPFLPDIPECRQELAEYYMSVERADSGLVRLIEILKENGLYDDTLIIYLSDNGVAFPGAKTNLYDPGIRLPLVVRNPHDEDRVTQTDAMVTWADITPTILDYAGIDSGSEEFHGRSFLSTLHQEHPEGYDEIFASHTFHEITMYYPMRLLRDRRYKLIWNIAHPLPFPHAGDLWIAPTWQATLERDLEFFGNRRVEDYLHRDEFELYDLQEDPWELNNLADDPSHAERLASMKAKIKHFQEDTGDPWFVKWEHE